MSSKWTSTLGVWENAIPSKRNKIAVCFSILILWECSYLLRSKSSGQLCRLRQRETRVPANGHPGYTHPLTPVSRFSMGEMAFYEKVIKVKADVAAYLN
jgi:hypothetical protein